MSKSKVLKGFSAALILALFAWTAYTAKSTLHDVDTVRDGGAVVFVDSITTVFSSAGYDLSDLPDLTQRRIGLPTRLLLTRTCTANTCKRAARLEFVHTIGMINTSAEGIEAFLAGRIDNGSAHRVRMLGCYESLTSDEHMKMVAQFGNLHELSLGRTNVTDFGCRPLSHLPKLKSLSLRETRVSDKGVRVLSNGRSQSCLLILYLSGCPVTDESVEYIGRFHNLRTVSVRGTRISEGGVSRLQTMLPNANIEYD